MKIWETTNTIARLIFEPRDLWIGVYIGEPWWEMGQKWHCVYVCLIPTVPLKIAWITEGKR